MFPLFSFKYVYSQNIHHIKSSTEINPSECHKAVVVQGTWDQWLENKTCCNSAFKFRADADYSDPYYNILEKSPFLTINLNIVANRIALCFLVQTFVMKTKSNFSPQPSLHINYAKITQVRQQIICNKKNKVAAKLHKNGSKLVYWIIAIAIKQSPKTGNAKWYRFKI